MLKPLLYDMYVPFEPVFVSINVRFVYPETTESTLYQIETVLADVEAILIPADDALDVPCVNDMVRSLL